MQFRIAAAVCGGSEQEAGTGRQAPLRPVSALLALLILVAPGSMTPCARAGQGFAAKVLAARDEDAKGLAAVRGRKQGLDAESVVAVVKRERFSSVVSLVVGMYLEKGEFEHAKTLAVVKALAARKGLYGKAAAMAAWSPHAEQIVKGLIVSGSASSRLLAASIVAAYAHGESLAQAAKGAPGKNKGKKRRARAGKGGLANVDLEPLVTRLLADRAKEVQELAALAAAYARIEAAGAAIARLKHTTSPTLAGVRLLFLARTGKGLPEELTRKVLGVRVAVPRRYAKLSPLLHSYDLRGHALLYGCQAVGEAGDGRFAAPLHELLDHPDLRVQMEAARALERVGSHESVAVLLEKLRARPPWPVKVAVLGALGAIPARESVEPLFALLEAERGRFRQDAAYALASICPPLAKLHPSDRRRWWAEHGEGFIVDVQATREFRRSHRVQDIAVEALAEFYGGKVISNRAVFVLDTSMSMKGEKIKSLKLNMAATLQSLPAHVKFNVVDFGGIVRVMRPGALIDASHRHDAKQMVDYMDLTYGTRTFDAMEAATRLPGMDTLHYLSDGAPVAGQFEAWARIVRAFDLYNRYRPIAMHCILYAPQGAGGAKGRGRAGGMEQLADHNAGLMSVSGKGD